MRNDVKLGFAIGGVLLAVLIVYVLVVPGGTSQQKKSAQSNSTSSGSTANAGKTGGVTLDPVVPPTASGTSSTPAVPPPAVADNKGTSGDKVATAEKPGDKVSEKNAEKTDPFAPKPADTDTVAKAPTKNNDLDWNKLLNEQPVLMTETPVSAGSAKGHTPAPAFTPPAPAASPAEASATPPAAEPVAQLPTPAPIAPVEPAAPVVATGVEPAAPSTQPAGARTHVVQSGETLSSISTAAYGNANFYPAILRANPGVDPTHMKPGQKINLPDIASVKPAAQAGAVAGSAQIASSKVAAAPIDSNKEYRVQPGDSLYKIALKLYGRGDRADKIYQFNKTAIGEDPHRLKAGQLLQLPDPPSTATNATAASAAGH